MDDIYAVVMKNKDSGENTRKPLPELTHDLQHGHLEAQKRTFTNWCNAHLQHTSQQIEDILVDLRSGQLLLLLLGELSGVYLGRPNKGNLRVHHMENLHRCLDFLSTKVRLENIGATDLVEGNPTLTLGLLWTIISRFQIEEGVRHRNFAQETQEQNAKERLLTWCRQRTEQYRGVHVTNFSGCWRNGLAFLALIHSYRPDLFEYDSAEPNDHSANLSRAFQLAHQHFGVPKLLDVSDVDVPKPDDRSVMTYVSELYRCLLDYEANPAPPMNGVSDETCVAIDNGSVAESEQVTFTYSPQPDTDLDVYNLVTEQEEPPAPPPPAPPPPPLHPPPGDVIAPHVEVHMVTRADSVSMRIGEELEILRRKFLELDMRIDRAKDRFSECGSMLSGLTLRDGDSVMTSPAVMTSSFSTVSSPTLTSESTATGEREAGKQRRFRKKLGRRKRLTGQSGSVFTEKTNQSETSRKRVHHELDTLKQQFNSLNAQLAMVKPGSIELNPEHAEMLQQLSKVAEKVLLVEKRMQYIQDSGLVWANPQSTIGSVAGTLLTSGSLKLDPHGKRPAVYGTRKWPHLQTKDKEQTKVQAENEDPPRDPAQDGEDVQRQVVAEVL